MRFKENYGPQGTISDNHQTVKALNEKDFNTLSDTIKRTNPFWQGVECIQTCIKSKKGFGKHVFVKYQYDGI